MREHLASVARQTGRLPQRLAEARALPEGLEQLWEDFIDLHGCRQNHGFGPSRITFMDIDAWQRVNHVTLPPWQIAAIRAADNAFLASLPRSGGK